MLFLTHTESFLNHRSYRNMTGVKSAAHMSMFFERTNEIVTSRTSGIKAAFALKLSTHLTGQFGPPVTIGSKSPA